ncbi:50S ribosomal protein L24 [Candidatus Peregrinibacteria bacterium]|nr:50S ribosomal protein L24 [Candidatus Peregrinibacteria bacterium]
MKIHVNDNVMVISGKDKGKKGLVMRLSDKSGKVVVEKVNIRTKHIKKSQGQAGQKIRFEAPVSASNVMVICPNCSKVTRVAQLILKTGKKQRVCKKCNQTLDKPFERKRTKKR